jgi:hypothetical protein
MLTRSVLYDCCCCQSILTVFLEQDVAYAGANATLICDKIRQRISENSYESLTAIYKKLHNTWLSEQQKNLKHMNQPLRDRLLQLNIHPPDFDMAVRELKGLSSLVTVADTYTCMQSIVVVCTIDRSHLEGASAKVMAWVKVLSSAYEMRQTFEAEFMKYKQPYVSLSPSPSQIG